MDVSNLALKTLARITPEAAEKRLIQMFLEFDERWCSDIIARPDVYRAAIRNGLPTLPTTQRQYLERVWADIETRLARGSATLFSDPTPDEPGLSADAPSGQEWHEILRAPFDDSDTDQELLEMAIKAGWMHPITKDYLIDIGQRLQEIFPNGL